MRDAESIIQAAIDHIGVSVSLAELWHDRIRSHIANGDRRRAELAYFRARMWACFYASSATSGGEGAALSAERDRMVAEFRRTLGFDTGDDPGFVNGKAALDQG